MPVCGKHLEDGATTRFVFLPNAAEPPAGAAFPPRTAAQEYNNRIVTAKYTWWNFIPKSIFEQFRRIANFYFLVQLILMFVGQDKSLNAFVNDLSPVGTLVALILVISVTMILHLKDDLVRCRKDRETNEAPVHKLQAHPAVPGEPEGAEVVDVQCQSLVVGDLILVRSGEEIPADCVILASSEGNGLAYVETANLDGETNLKRRRAIDVTHRAALQSFAEEGLPWDTDPGAGPGPVSVPAHALTAVLQLPGVVACELPNKKIHDFSGEYLAFGTADADVIAATEEAGTRVALNIENILLRGCRLRNCAWVLGVVVYAGRQTKAAMNNSKPPSKLSRMEKVVNRFMLIAFGLQLIMVLASDFSNNAWYLENVEALDMWYLNPLGETRQLALPNLLAYFFTFFVLYNNMIPISMYVMMEIANFVHAAFINEDAQMYKASVDGKALCRSANLCQELGQVEYIFTDKTGTLTANEMVFKMASIGGILYGSPDHPFDHGLMLAANSAKSSRMLHDYWLALSLCHTVSVSDVDRDATHSKAEIEAQAIRRQAMGLPPAKFYDGESPDEIAFVRAAADVGYIFEGCERNVYHLRTPYTPRGQQADRYTILAVNKFDHERRCMSVVVQCPGGSIKLLMKGADSAVLPLAAHATSASKHEKHVRIFGAHGLRTLAVAVREIPEKEAAMWLRLHNEAASEINDRQRALTAVAKQIERDMEILGISAIEDRLQDSTADTIATLRAAGIKMWVLTGDMTLTAITIGYSSRLLKAGQQLLKYEVDPFKSDEENRDALRTRLAVDIMLVKDTLSNATTKKSSKDSDSFALIIEGKALHLLLGPMEAKSPHDRRTSPLDTDNVEADLAERAYLRFVELATMCDCVLACRVSPSQKAQLVYVVRNTQLPGTRWPRREPCTLAIGDGANDVAMIQMAHVGVGLSGKEGRQAVNSSDFAIHEFGFLKRLLIVHGQWNYDRVSKLILYSFYKNACFMWLQFFYSFETGFSGTAICTGILNTLYNFATALSIIALSVCEREFSENQMFATPALFKQGIVGSKLNGIRMTLEQLRAVAHAALIWFVCYLLIPAAEMERVSEQRHFGTIVYLALVLAMNVRAIYLTSTWTWINHFGLVCTCVGALIVLPVVTVWMDLDYAFFNVFFHLLQAPVFYLAMVAVPCILSLFDMICTLLDEYLRFDCLNPVDVPGIIDTDPHPQEEWHAPSLSRKDSRHITLHPHLHDPKVVEAEKAAIAELQRSAQFSHHKSEQQIEAETARRHSPIWQQDLHASTWVPQEHFVRCFSMLGIVFAVIGCLTVISSSNVQLVQVQYGGNESRSFSELPRLTLFPENSRFTRAGDFDAPGDPSGCRLASELGLKPGLPLRRLNQYDIVAEGFYSGVGGSYPANAVVCDVNITIPFDMPAPVSVMYRLDRFWQNYQIYIDDFDETEMKGKHSNASTVDPLPDCRYFVFRNTTGDTQALLDEVDEDGVHTYNGTVLIPCGLIANTMFTDEFTLIAQDGENGTLVPINSTHLSWPSDLQHVKNSAAYPYDRTPYWKGYPEAKTKEYLFERYSHIVTREEGVHNERFLVWSRPEMLSDFRKLYGIVNSDLSAGAVLTLRVVSSFDVASYHGAKAVVLTTYGALGGDCSIFGTVLLFAAALSFLCALGAWCRNTFTHRHVAPDRHKRRQQAHDTNRRSRIVPSQRHAADGPQAEAESKQAARGPVSRSQETEQKSSSSV